MRTIGVIEIGSTGIRLLVANLSDDGSFELLDGASKPVSLGRDVFGAGSISRESIREAIAVLRGFRELLRSYGVTPQETRVVGTSALREAGNRDAFVDRVAMRTGFRVEVVEDIEESHYMYLAVRRALGDDAKFFARSNSIIMEVGGGSTEVMLLRRGRIVAAHSLRLGTARLDESSRAVMGASGHMVRFLADHVRTACDGLDDDLPLNTVRNFIVIGSDARLAARIAGVQGREDYSVVPRKDYADLVDRLRGLGPDAIVSEYHLPYAEAEALAPGLVIINLFLERTAAEELVIPNVSIRDGILVAMAGGAAGDIEAEMRRHVVASATGLGRRFRFDEAHARHVAELSLFLFDKLAAMHGMGHRERRLLEVAALLHDIGTFIRASGHHRHSEYIILNSELFGLRGDELSLIAGVARFHRKAAPGSSNANYMSLSREDRVVVLKLASMLRLADSLDRGHTQRLRIVELEEKEDHLVLRTDSRGDISIERLTLAEKSDLFEDVFGLKVVAI